MTAITTVAPHHRETTAQELGIPGPTGFEIHVYTDGACSGNPGPGGWGAVLLPPGGAAFELWGGAEQTTNNRMELMAAIAGVAHALDMEGAKIVVMLDSQYVEKGITEWIWGWKKRNWRIADGSPVKNAEFWQEFDRRVTEVRTVGKLIEFRWIKGHAGNPGNEHADRLARRHGAP